MLIPPSPQPWRLLPNCIHSYLSRVPSVYGDTAGIFVTVYYPDPDGTFINNGKSYRPIQVPLSFEPWKTEKNEVNKEDN